MTTKFLEQLDGKIAYDEDGSGPLVICVPSMGDVRAEYRFMAPRLISSGYRVATMDVRGHGESSIRWADFSVAGVGADILAMIRELGDAPAYIIGASMAAGAAVWAAAEAPEQVSGLVLIGPFVRGETNWQSRLLYGALFARPWGPALWQKYYTGLYRTRKPADLDAYSAALRVNLTQKGRLEALKQMMLASKSASEMRLAQVEAPALVLMGSKDPDFKQPEAEARWLAGRLNTHYQIIAGAGHYPHAEMPEMTAQIILHFLQSAGKNGQPASPVEPG